MTRDRVPTLFAVLLVIIVSNVTYFRNYGYPRGSIYDEAFYIADAQKYLHGVSFMQDHPPLGKLLIAAGERLFHVNGETNDARFLNDTVAREFPPDFSFLGYRFFPALLAWWTAPIFFLVFLRLTGSRVLALLLSAFYVFDNALIVHLRGALLEGPLVFFSAAAMFAFLRLHDGADRGAPAVASAVFGALLALAVASKEAALILGVLPLALAWRLRAAPRRALAFLACAGAAFLVTYAAVWQTHFAIARTVNPALPSDGYFDASPAYRQALASGRGGSLATFPIAMLNAWTYTANWNRNLPVLDMCNPDEPGSPPYYWPFGGRTIDYRSETTDGHTFRYAYLQSNPAVWWMGLLAMLTATALVLASPWSARLRRWPRRPIAAVFVAMYWIYMIGLSLMSRVLYMHSYFLPLLFTFVAAGTLVADADVLAGAWWTRTHRALALTPVAAAIIACYVFFYPLTYYEPLTEAQFARRAWLGVWDLRCGSCGKREPPPGCRPSP